MGTEISSGLYQEHMQKVSILNRQLTVRCWPTTKKVSLYYRAARGASYSHRFWGVKTSNRRMRATVERSQLPDGSRKLLATATSLRSRGSQSWSKRDLLTL